MGADGSNPIRLIDDPALDKQPAYSPDGTRIVFRSNRNGPDDEIVVMDADGSNQTVLTSNSENDGQADWQPRCPGFETAVGPHLIGTLFDDVIVGTPGSDLVCGLAGNDVIAGLGGDDVILAGGGADRVNGGAGRDLVLGEGGNDRLRGGGGADRLKGGPGRDRLHGGAGPDRCTGGPGKDVVRPSCER